MKEKQSEFQNIAVNFFSFFAIERRLSTALLCLIFVLEHRPALPPCFAGGSDRQTFPAVMSSLPLGDNEALAVTQQQAHVLLNHRHLVGLLALAGLFSGMSVFYR